MGTTAPWLCRWLLSKLLLLLLLWGGRRESCGERGATRGTRAIAMIKLRAPCCQACESNLAPERTTNAHALVLPRRGNASYRG